MPILKQMYDLGCETERVNLGDFYGYTLTEWCDLVKSFRFRIIQKFRDSEIVEFN